MTNQGTPTRLAASMKSGAVALLVLPLGLTACADDSGGGKDYNDPIPASEGEKATARGAVTSADDMRSLHEEPANQSAMQGLTGAYGQLSALANLKLAAQAEQGANNPGSQFGFLTTVQGALEEGCYSTDGNTTTYDNCSTGGFTIDGTVTATETRVAMDLRMASSSGGGFGMDGFALDMTGGLDFGPSSISGELRYETVASFSDASPGGDAFSTSSTIRAFYDVITTGGCPTGGTLEINQVTSIDSSAFADLPGGAGGAGNMNVWVKAEFGPECGDVTLY